MQAKWEKSLQWLVRLDQPQLTASSRSFHGIVLPCNVGLNNAQRFSLPARSCKTTTAVEPSKPHRMARSYGHCFFSRQLWSSLR